MNLNFLKGVLIMLVIVDHNEFTRDLFPAFFKGLSFHVIGFMAIPFLKPAPRLGSADFAAYVFRLYYPFMMLACALWLLVSALGPDPWPQRLGLLAVALYSGNADILKSATHMGLLWFLPSFITIVAIRAAAESRGPALKLGVLALLLAIHPLVGALKGVQDYLPMGLLPALYIVPLAYAVVALHRAAFERLPAWPALAVAALGYAAVKALQMQMKLGFEVGFAEVATWETPLALLVNDLEGVLGTLMLFQLARVGVQGVFAACGRVSMQIYLFHAFVALGIYKALMLFAPGQPRALLFVVSVAATVGLTLALARLIMAWPLSRRLISPRSFAELAGRPGPVAKPAAAPHP